MVVIASCAWSRQFINADIGWDRSERVGHAQIARDLDAISISTRTSSSSHAKRAHSELLL